MVIKIIKDPRVSFSPRFIPISSRHQFFCSLEINETPFDSSLRCIACNRKESAINYYKNQLLPIAKQRSKAGTSSAIKLTIRPFRAIIRRAFHKITPSRIAGFRSCNNVSRTVIRETAQWRIHNRESTNSQYAPQHPRARAAARNPKDRKFQRNNADF